MGMGVVLLASAALLVDVVRDHPVPVFLTPTDFKADDFRVEWKGDAIEGIDASIEPNSIQWVRVGEVIRLPRGRLKVRVSAGEAGHVSNNGFTQALVCKGDVCGADMLVPLVSGDANPIEVRLRRAGEEKIGQLRIRFEPKKPSDARVFIDTTCSQFGLRFETSAGTWENEWAYVGCRVAGANAEKHRTSSLELVVFWDNVGDVVRVDGLETRSTGASVWNLRTSSSPGHVRVAAEDHEVTLRYFVSDHPRKAFIGVGIGPYVDEFSPSKGVTKYYPTPLLTFYGAYTINPNSRIVGFNATPVRPRGYSDSGLYYVRKTSESLDRRITTSVFLGAHLLFYDDGLEKDEIPTGSTAIAKIRRDFSAPQGAEMLVRDVGGQGFNVLAGALVNPGIGDRSYYNAWLRWGNARAFIELNYIAWTLIVPADTAPDGTPLPERTINLRSAGITVGFPLFRFL